MCDTCRRTGTPGTVPANIPNRIDAELQDVRLLGLDEPTLDCATVLRLEGAEPIELERPRDWLGAPQYGQTRLAIAVLLRRAVWARGRKPYLESYDGAITPHEHLERDDAGEITEAELVRLRRQMHARRHGCLGTACRDVPVHDSHQGTGRAMFARTLGGGCT